MVSSEGLPQRRSGVSAEDCMVAGAEGEPFSPGPSLCDLLCVVFFSTLYVVASADVASSGRDAHWIQRLECEVFKGSGELWVLFASLLRSWKWQRQAENRL